MSAKTLVVRNDEGLLEERAVTVAGRGEELLASNPSAWANIFLDGNDGSSVPNVSKEQAQRFVTMQSCIRIRSQSLSQLPLRVMRKVDRNWEEQLDHPVNDLLSWKPNREQNAIVWKRYGSRIADTDGNFYCWIARQRGEPDELIPLVPGTTSPYREKGRNYYATTIEINGEQKLMTIEPRDMIHIYYHPDDTGIRGRVPLTDLQASLAQGIQGRDYVSKLLAKGGNIGGWIKHPSNFKGKDAAQKFREQWEQAYSGISNAGKTAVLEQGMEYNQLKPMSGTDVQTLDNRKFTRDEIIGFYQIPPHMISVLDKANYNNLGSLDTYYIKHTLMPITRCWEMELTLKLITDEERRQGYCIKFDFSEMRRGDPEQERQFAKDGIVDGWLNRNEIRERNELPITDDRLGEFVLPVNIAPLSVHDTPPAGEGEELDDEPELIESDTDDRSSDLLIPVVRSILDKHLRVLGRGVAKIANSSISLPEIEIARQIGGKVDRSCELLSEDMQPVATSMDSDEILKRADKHYRSMVTNLLEGQELKQEADNMTRHTSNDEDAKAVIYE